MENELNRLGGKITELIRAYEGACARNQELHERLTELQAENKRLVERLALAATRVEDILARLPEDAV